MATNHMGHFYLTNLLLPKMKAQLTMSRIIIVSSMYHIYANLYVNDLHFKNSRYNRWTAYANSKLANILFMKALAIRLEHSNVSTVALHPGITATNLLRNIKAIRFPFHIYMLK